jgi:hypothetical protein
MRYRSRGQPNRLFGAFAGAVAGDTASEREVGVDLKPDAVVPERCVLRAEGEHRVDDQDRVFG